jgi:hypothetical protein
MEVKTALLEAHQFGKQSRPHSGELSHLWYRFVIDERNMRPALEIKNN